MTDDDFDNLDLLDDDTDDRYVRLHKNDVDRLRSAAKRSSKLEKEIGAFKRTEAIRSAGLTELSEKQINALSKIVDDPTPETLRSEAEALGWIQQEANPNDPTADELDAHTEIAGQGQGAAPIASRRIKPEDTAGWTHEKRMRLDRDHPDLYELLMRGEEIDAPAGFLL